MNLNDLKKLINGKGERVILVEDGEPTVVVMPFNEYKKMSGNSYGEENFSVEDETEEGVENYDQEWQNPFDSPDFAEFFSKPKETEAKPGREKREDVKVEKKSLETINEKAKDAPIDQKNELTLEDLPF